MTLAELVTPAGMSSGAIDPQPGYVLNALAAHGSGLIQPATGPRRITSRPTKGPHCGWGFMARTSSLFVPRAPRLPVLMLAVPVFPLNPNQVLEPYSQLTTAAAVIHGKNEQHLSVAIPP